ncbi:MAG: alpha/beta hydrolase [Gemmataceae bacterium]
MIRSMLLGLVVIGLVAPVRGEEAKAAKVAAKTYEVEVSRDVDYYQGVDADEVRHKLDIYSPKGAKNCPVILFVHGGAWRHGAKQFLGIYEALGKHWAKEGVVFVVPNYRLTPKVQHPEHIRDVARAFAWTHKNIGKYGGSPEQLFVCGHSAGGHLCALLATNEKYLKAEGLGLDTIKGAMPLSGVYRIPDKSWLFDAAFGKDTDNRRDASPQANINGKTPPFLIICADQDFPYCGKDTSEPFCKALQGKKCDASFMEIADRNHMTLIVYASRAGDPVADAMRQFIDRRLRSE